MLLTLTNTRHPATDLGWLLHKHPAKVQSFSLAFGAAHVFYPAADDARCTASLVLDVDPVGLVRKRRGPAGDRFALEQYVNDRPYVASSFLSVAIAQVFGSALGGRCKDRPDLVDAVLPLEAKLAVVPCRGGEEFLRELFEPLGYVVQVQRHALDGHFAGWGDSAYYTLTLRAEKRVQDLLAHLYVLIPVLDNDKHYWVDKEELEKLLRHGEGWLAAHPAREAITWRYLKRQPRLAREALARLAEEDQPDPDAACTAQASEEAALEQSILVSDVPGVLPAESTLAGEADAEPAGERAPSLHTLRLATILAVLRGCGAQSVLDLGCGEGRLLRLLLADFRFGRIVGVDASPRALQIACERLHLERMPPRQRERIELLHGALTYRDARLAGFDAAACVEVIEHLDPPRLEAFSRALFEFARPGTIVMTTPNREYNVRFPTLAAGKLRHRDHRFEWTRAEFGSWGDSAALRFGYLVRYLGIGPEDAAAGAPTQMAVFTLEVRS
jgi:SAM-dependent methyltransferase